MALQDVLFAVDADKQFYKIIGYESNLNRFYDQTNYCWGAQYWPSRIASLTKTSDWKWEIAKFIHICKSILPRNLIKACDLFHCELKDWFNENIPSVLAIEKPW